VVTGRDEDNIEKMRDPRDTRPRSIDGTAMTNLSKISQYAKLRYETRS
jgi:hypothetical protein